MVLNLDFKIRYYASLRLKGL